MNCTKETFLKINVVLDSYTLTYLFLYITDKEWSVLERRLIGTPLKTTGKKLTKPLSVERTRQVELKACRKLSGRLCSVKKMMENEI